MITINDKIELEGVFSFKVYNSITGKERDVSDIIAKDNFNLVLNSGLNALGTSSIAGSCKVGTGVTPVAVEQSELALPLALTSTIQASSTGRLTDPPYYTWGRRTYRFAQGAATGNLTEVGVTGSSSTSLFSRALIVDAEGKPAMLTILNDEWLDVTYELRVYQDLTDKTFNMTLLGKDHVVTVRPAVVTDAPQGDSYFFSHFISWYSSSQVVHYNGAIGTITNRPAGTSTDAESVGYSSYVNNSYNRTITASSGLNYSNIPGGITSTYIRTNKSYWQVGYSPAIDKDSFKTLVLNYTLSWGRYDT